MSPQEQQQLAQIQAGQPLTQAISQPGPTGQGTPAVQNIQAAGEYARSIGRPDLMPQAQSIIEGEKLAKAAGIPYIKGMSFWEVAAGLWPISSSVQKIAFYPARKEGTYSPELLASGGIIYTSNLAAFEAFKKGQLGVSGGAGSWQAILAEPWKYPVEVEALGLVPKGTMTSARLAATGAVPSTITREGGVYVHPVYSPAYQGFAIQAGQARQNVENLMTEARAKGWVEGSTITLPGTAEGQDFATRYNTAAQAQYDVYVRGLTGGVIIPKPGGIAGGGGYLPGPGQVRTAYDVVSGREIVQSGQLLPGEAITSPVLAGGYIAGFRPTVIQPPVPPMQQTSPEGIPAGTQITSIGPTFKGSGEKLDITYTEAPAGSFSEYLQRQAMKQNLPPTNQIFTAGLAGWSLGATKTIEGIARDIETQPALPGGQPSSYGVVGAQLLRGTEWLVQAPAAITGAEVVVRSGMPGLVALGMMSGFMAWNIIESATQRPVETGLQVAGGALAGYTISAGVGKVSEFASTRLSPFGTTEVGSVPRVPGYSEQILYAEMGKEPPLTKLMIYREQPSPLSQTIEGIKSSITGTVENIRRVTTPAGLRSGATPLPGGTADLLDVEYFTPRRTGTQPKLTMQQEEAGIISIQEQFMKSEAGQWLQEKQVPYTPTEQGAIVRTVQQSQAYVDSLAPNKVPPMRPWDVWGPSPTPEPMGPWPGRAVVVGAAGAGQASYTTSLLSGERVIHEPLLSYQVPVSTEAVRLGFMPMTAGVQGTVLRTAPGQGTIRIQGTGETVASALKSGMIPSWLTDPIVGAVQQQAQGESQAVQQGVQQAFSQIGGISLVSLGAKTSTSQRMASVQVSGMAMTSEMVSEVGLALVTSQVVTPITVPALFQVPSTPQVPYPGITSIPGPGGTPWFPLLPGLPGGGSGGGGMFGRRRKRVEIFPLGLDRAMLSAMRKGSQNLFTMGPGGPVKPKRKRRKKR